MIKLAVVYGLRDTNADYDWLMSFYPVRRIQEECTRRSVDVHFFFPQDVVTLSIEQVADFNLFLLRGEIPCFVYDFLEQHKVPHVNTRQSVQAANDKMIVYSLLKDTSVRLIPLVDTVAMSADTKVSDVVTVVSDFPVIVKPRFGQMGRDVEKVDSPEQLSALLATMRSRGVSCIVQHYEAESFGRDVRVTFCGGGITGCYRRVAAEGFKSNASCGSKTESIHLPVILKAWTQSIIEKTGLFTGTADYLYSSRVSEGFVLCEVNASPGFMHLEHDTGCNAAGTLIDNVILYCNRQQ